jgi:hypothetical protein
VSRAGPAFAAGVMIGALALASIAAAGRGMLAAGPSVLTGADWKAYGAREREAYLNGFLTGVAAGQLPAQDTAPPSAAIAALRAAKGLRFPYAPNVYSVQLDDYYFYTDRLPTPVVDALARMNRQMLEPPR